MVVVVVVVVEGEATWCHPAASCRHSPPLVATAKMAAPSGVHRTPPSPPRVRLLPGRRSKQYEESSDGNVPLQKKELLLPSSPVVGARERGECEESVCKGGAKKEE